MRRVLLATAALLTTTASAQWTIQDSHTTASFRGVNSLGHGIAWVSGTQGTVLRTMDGGEHWQHCAVPEGAEKLDFRGVQALDERTAIVMSSGPGDLSRLYKTTDGCATWKLMFTNPDKDGFWDGIRGELSADKSSVDLTVVGDPVHASFTLFQLHVPIHGGELALVPLDYETCKDTASLQLPIPIAKCLQERFNKMVRAEAPHLVGGQARAEEDRSRLLAAYANPQPTNKEALFAASNSSLANHSNTWFSPDIAFVTGGLQGAHFFHFRGWPCAGLGCRYWRISDIPLAHSESAGAFSIQVRAGRKGSWNGVIVGGDYKLPNERSGTAAFSNDEGKTWKSPAVLPGGYRSSVAFSSDKNAWITVGPNGTDVSFDDGRNWIAMKPSADDTPDADQHWNALSLPFVVGERGHIGILRDGAVEAARKTKP